MRLAGTTIIDLANGIIENVAPFGKRITFNATVVWEGFRRLATPSS